MTGERFGAAEGEPSPSPSTSGSVPPASAAWAPEDNIRAPVAVAEARLAVDILAGKWVIPIVAVLAAGHRRHGDLHDALGLRAISQKVLTETLRRMEAAGLVTRYVRSEVPPTVFYCLTELGHSLLEPIRHLAAWWTANACDLEHPQPH